MNTHRNFSDKIWLFLKGLGMGAANKVPGVSGGVVAFVGGFYEEFIYSLQKVNKKAFKLLIAGRFKSFFQYINGGFLSILIAEMVVSYFSVSKILDYLIEHFELYVWSAFFGMIIGSIYYLVKDFGDWKIRYLFYLLVGTAAGLGISFLEPATENDNLIFVFICGIISVSGMTLPGLSGSFILILLGNYVLLLVDSVNALYDTLAEIIFLDFSFLNNQDRIRLLKVLISFSLGSIAGLVILSNLLSYLLKYFKSATYAGIIGFITGSLGVVWPWKEKIYAINELGEVMVDVDGNPVLSNYDRFIPNSLDYETLIAIFFIFVGILIVLALGWYGELTKKTD